MATTFSTVRSALKAILQAYAPMLPASEDLPFAAPYNCDQPDFPQPKCYGSDNSRHSDSR